MDDDFHLDARQQNIIPNAFARLLQTRCPGRALLHPREASQRGGALGDVGYFEHGGFIKEFNIYDPSDRYVPLPRRADMWLVDQDYRAGMPLKSSRRSEIEFKFDASVAVPPLQQAPLHVQPNITLKDDEYASLYAYAPVMRDWMLREEIKHVKNWLVRHIHIAEPNTCVLTSRVRASGWISVYQAAHKHSMSLLARLRSALGGAQGNLSRTVDEDKSAMTRGPHGWTAAAAEAKYTIIVGYSRALSRLHYKRLLAGSKITASDFDMGESHNPPQVLPGALPPGAGVQSTLFTPMSPTAQPPAEAPAASLALYADEEEDEEEEEDLGDILMSFLEAVLERLEDIDVVVGDTGLILDFVEAYNVAPVKSAVTIVVEIRKEESTIGSMVETSAFIDKLLPASEPTVVERLVETKSLSSIGEPDIRQPVSDQRLESRLFSSPYPRAAQDSRSDLPTGGPTSIVVPHGSNTPSLTSESATVSTGDAHYTSLDDTLRLFRKLSPTGVSEESVLFGGPALEALFYRSGEGESVDVDRAIENYASQLERGPAGIKEEIALLLNLSRCYRDRYIGGSHLASDIDEAITLLNRAIELVPQAEPPPGFSRSLSQTLASYYTARFYRGPSHVTDLDKAIDIYRSTKVPNAVAPAWYMDYGQCLQCRLQIHRDSAAMDEMISVFEEGARYVPEQHSQRPYILVGLASARMQAFLFDASRPGFRFVPSRAKEVLMTYVDAANAADIFGGLYATRAFSRFYAQCHMLMPSLDWAQGFVDPRVVKNMQSRFLDRLSETMWLGHTVSRRYQEAAVHQSDVGATVANALLLQDHVAALEYFEQGRAVVWSQIQNLRTPLDDLREKYPDLAEMLEKLSLELEKAGGRVPLPLGGPSDILPWGHTAPVEEEAVAGRRLAREHKALLEHIRSLEGFETFLRPKRADALLKAAATRAVACINVHASRCDALIIFGSNMHHVHLDQLTPAKIDGWHVKLTSFLRQERARAIENPRKSMAVQPPQRFDDIQGVLQEMWDFVVWPILAVYLDKLEPVHGRAHITWCTAGQLAFLPLHAAGPYDGTSPDALDLVVSSYAPNLSSLLPPATATTSESAPSPSILVVAQPNAPGVRPLPGTVEESKTVAANFPSDSAQILLGEQGTIEEVVNRMAKHPYVHLACHGQQDADPTKSAFFLHDGRLTLQTLMAHKSSNAQLAFLSACETATGDETVPNEAVYLAAGMLAAGYKSVVATMWSIGDNEAPRVADEFYRALLADPERNVAFALHDAVKKLREHVGVDNFVKWMPFIHLGV